MASSKRVAVFADSPARTQMAHLLTAYLPNEETQKVLSKRRIQNCKLQRKSKPSNLIWTTCDSQVNNLQVITKLQSSADSLMLLLVLMTKRSKQ